MTKQTRRRFLKQSTVGVATVGVLAAAPRLAAVAKTHHYWMEHVCST